MRGQEKADNSDFIRNSVSRQKRRQRLLLHQKKRPHIPIYVALNPHCSVSIEQSTIKDTNMDGSSTPAKKARKSPYPWTTQHKMVLEKIITKDDGHFNEKLKSKNRDTQKQAWTDIIVQFKQAFNMDEVDRKSLQGLWQRMKDQHKVVHDRTLLNLYRETRTTGGGPGPSQVPLGDPDEFDEGTGMESQSDLSGMTLSQNSPLLTPWNTTSRVRNLPHTVTSSTVQSDQVVEITVPVNNRGDDILSEAMALTDVVDDGQQVMVDDDSNQSLPDPEAHAAAPTIFIGDNDPNPAVPPTPTLAETPARAPKRPSAASKATAYVAAAEYTKEYWTEKLKMEKELYNARKELLAGQIENEKLSKELLLLKIQKARQELDYQ